MTPIEDEEPFGTSLRRIELVVALMSLAGQEAVERMTPLLHPQVRVLAAPGVAPAGGYEGREAFLEYFAAARTQGVLVRPDAHEIRATPSGVVLVTGALCIISPAGTDELPAWFVYAFRDGLIASFATYLDAGMAEDAATDGLRL